MKITKLMRVAALSLALALTVPSVLPAAVPAATVEAAAKKLNKTKLVLPKKGTYTLSVNTSKKVTWKSSNTSVATVSKKGKVIAKKVGKTTITASFGKKKLTCKVTVLNVRLNKTTAKIDLGSTNSAKRNLQLRVLGLSEAEQAEVSWFSSDTDIATVSAGSPTSVASVGIRDEGTVTITAKYHGAAMTCKVTVVNSGRTVDPKVYPQGAVVFQDANDDATKPETTLDNVTITSASVSFVKFEEAYKTQTGSLSNFDYTYHVTVTGSVDAKNKDKVVAVSLWDRSSGEECYFAYVPDPAVKEALKKAYEDPYTYKEHFMTDTLYAICDANGNFTFNADVKSYGLGKELSIGSAYIM